MESNFEQKIALIGDSGNGKTCFIAALRWLGSSQHVSSFTNIGADGDTNSYLKSLEGLLREGFVPPGTQVGSVLNFQEIFRDCKFNIRTCDIPGGGIKVMEKDSPIFKMWQESDYLLVFFDAKSIQSGKDVTGIDDVFDRLSNIVPSGKKLAVLLTKSDTVGITEYDSPECAMSFFKRYRPSVVEKVNGLGFKSWNCFFIASLGVSPTKDDDDRMHLPPGAPKPQGYDALFDWLVEKENIRQPIFVVKKLLKKSFPWLVVIVCVFAVWGICYAVISHRKDSAVQKYNDPKSTLEERAEATRSMRREDANRLIDETLTEYEKELSSQTVIDDIRNLIKEGTGLLLRRAALSDEQRGRLRQIEEAKKQKLGEAAMSKVQRLIGVGCSAEAKELIVKLLTDDMILPEARNQLMRTLEGIEAEQEADEKRKILGITISDIAGTEKMKEKINAILAFFSSHPGDNESKRDAENAVADMKKLIESRVFRISKIAAGELRAQRNSCVVLACGNWGEDKIWDEKDEHLHTVFKKSKTITSDDVGEGCVVWDNREIEKAEIVWSPGDKMKVEWIRASTWGRKVIADQEIAGGWVTLLEMLQRHVICDRRKQNGYFKNGPWIEMSCEEFPDPAASLERIKRFIIPGTYWIED